MDHGRDEHSLFTHTVDDAIAVDQEFADGVVAELGGTVRPPRGKRRSLRVVAKIFCTTARA